MAFKKLAQGAIGTGAGTLAYTAPSGYRAYITEIAIANTTAAAISVSLHIVPADIAVGTTNMLFPAVSVPANTLIQWTGKQLLNTGDFIQAIGSGAGLTMNICGDEDRQ